MWSMMELKSVRQIGNLPENERIYIEEKAYKRLHREESAQKRCFILMGHNERGADGYRSVIESAFLVESIPFEQGVPIWNAKVWREVFGEVKRQYENMVILGWALDIKGKMAFATPEMELIHKEQFGGVRQLFFLMDTLEGEEAFYRVRNNHLLKQEGFFVYDDGKVALESEDDTAYDGEYDIKTELSPNIISENYRKLQQSGEPEVRTARYRELCKAIPRETTSKRLKHRNGEEKGGMGFAVAAVVLILLAMLGTGIWQNRISLEQIQDAVTTMKEMGTSDPNTAGETENDTQTAKQVTIERTRPGDIFEEPQAQ